MAEEPAQWTEHSSSMMRDLKDYRRKRNRELRARVAQAVGGGAETMRTGASAAETFAKRAPYWQKDVMSSKEKLGAKRPILKDIEGIRQFDYTKELQKSTAILRAKHQREEAIARDIQAMRSQALSGSEARSRQLIIVKNAQAKENLDKQTEATTLSPMAEARIQSGFKSKNEYARELADQTATKRLDDQKVLAKKVKDNTATPDEEAALAKIIADNKVDTSRERPTQKELAAALTNDPHIQNAARADSLKAAKKIAEELIEGYSDTDSDIGVKKMATEADVTVEEIVGHPNTSLLAKEYDKDQSSAKKKREDLEKEFNEIDDKRERAALSIGTGAPKSALTPADEMDFSDISEAGVEDIEESVEDLETGVPKGEAAPEDYMAVPGRKRPMGAANRFEEMLKVIEEFPEHPPSVEAKKQIMYGPDGQPRPEYQSYMDTYGFKDPDLAFKEFKRDWRKRRQTDRRAFYEARLKKRGGEMDALKDKTVRRPPVQGDTSPGPAHVKKAKDITYGDVPIEVEP